MPLTKLQFRPGVNREVTSYSNEGGWLDGDKIRFAFGYPEKIGGWAKHTSSTYLGTARGLHNWLALDNSDLLGVGTHLKYYIEEGGNFNDVTPLRTSTTNSTTFAATNGSSTVTVTETNHGASVNDFVTFSSAVSLGGLVTATILNAEHKIVSVVDASNYTITVSVTANSSDTGNGGSATDAAYQLSAGLDSAVGGTGWGAGPWSGTADSTLGATTTYVVTVQNPGSGNEYYLDGSRSPALTFSRGNVYYFNLNDSSVDSHPLKFSTTNHGTHGSGSSYNTGVTYFIDGAVVSESDYVTNFAAATTRAIQIETNIASTNHLTGDAIAEVPPDTLYYYCHNHTGMGDSITSSSISGTTGWGASASIGTTTQIRLWSHDNFNEDLIINPRDGAVFYWDKTNGLSTRCVNISTLSGAENTPTVAKQILVSDQFHVFAFGTNTYGTSTQDPLLIRFSNADKPELWTVSNETSAGTLRIGSGSTFVKALKTKREILVWTDRSLHSVRYIGPDLYYGIAEISSNVTIMSPNAAIATEDFVFWMGNDNFYVYAGGTQQLPCSVKDKIFNDFNRSQQDKVFAGVNSEFGEVIWFYPSDGNSLANEGTGDIDKYVIYNYKQKIWYYGSLTRTAWIDRGVRSFPIAAGSSYLYDHENGYDDDGSAMTSFIESAPMDIGDGDKFSLISKVIPDITFDGSTNLSSPQATFSVKTRNFPGSNFNETASGIATRTSTTPVEQFTNQLHLRARGRSFAFRIDSNALGSKFKLGSPRINIRPDGRQ